MMGSNSPASRMIPKNTIAKRNIAATPTTPPSPSLTNPATSDGELPARNAAASGTPASATIAATRWVNNSSRMMAIVPKPS
ncbi:MAG: hypothetical protein U5O16_40830 [Rhodococcus sp. (in: high G+C Gram-positive bacteria)]|uniref:hypothetical protein n=1 Tax=Rhodococcus sp. TaxID=1831 RepID=UPI002ADA3E3A|nr:hypothetical protein [Rhodococcus sp. (in: high G+C Gram-positive bacteria)]